MVTAIELFECTDQTVLRFCLWGSLKSESWQKKVATRDELLARILYSAACIKKREVRLRRTTRHLRTRGAKCTEVDRGILECLL